MAKQLMCPYQRAALRSFASMPQDDKMHAGLHLTQMHAGMTMLMGFAPSPQRLKETVTALGAEGLIFPTIDEEHYRPTVSSPTNRGTKRARTDPTQPGREQLLLANPALHITK